MAVISLHTSPRDQPGTGDSGGMNVYVLEVAERLAEQGIQVDVFTRCHGSGASEIEQLSPGSRLIQVQAGPCAPVPKEDLPQVVPQFLDGVLARAVELHDSGPDHHPPYDVVHSHYWLSGWVGSRTKAIWGAPHVASFHTLGKVKNRHLGHGDLPEPWARLDGEQHVIEGADRILAPTPAEAAQLVGLYGADPNRIRVVPPGVDRSIFVPTSAHEAKARLHLVGARVLLFVGRLQPFKGPDVAIGALAEAVARAPETTHNLVLAVVGGPSGIQDGHDEVARLMQLAADIGVGDRVVFFPPQPHRRLADFYAAAEAVIMPSRSESFGLVALEAQSCGTPVIATAAGGLRYAVADGETGFLVPGPDHRGFAERIVAILADPGLRAKMSKKAVAHAARFSWDATAACIGRVYREVSFGRDGRGEGERAPVPGLGSVSSA